MKTTLELVNRMQAEGIIEKYAIGGAIGATFYLEPSATVDIDIFVVLRTSSSSLLLSLTPIYDYLRRTGCTTEGEHIRIGDWPVQFLPANSPLEEEALAQAVSTEVDGVPTRVMTAEHLVAIALRTGRSKDHGRILQFLEQGLVNTDQLESILQAHGLESKWQNFRRRFLGNANE